MSSFTYDFSDFDDFAEKMRQSESVVSEELRTGINRTTMTGEGFTKEKTPYATGHLRRSITFRAATYGGGMARGSWGTNTPYAEAVEEGRKAIVAPEGKALVFIPNKNSKVPKNGTGKWKGYAVYKSVKATTGVFMFKKALVRIRPVHRREMDGAIKRIITRLGGAR